VYLVYSPRYHIDIGPHVFPTLKYALVHDALRASGRMPASSFVEPEPASWEALAFAHRAEYLDKVRHGRLSAEEIAQLEIPWSPDVVEGFRLMSGGTIAAARLAREEGLAGHIGGGFHHAFANHGEGFCLFNDVAVAIRSLQREGLVRRVAVVDCDVHQGNGTAMIFDGDPDVFTFSIHQQHNYPVFKPMSDLDVGLPDGTGDREYLRRLDQALDTVAGSKPEAVFYLAGADPYEDDLLGGLALTRDGLRRRDRMVLERARGWGAAVAVLLAGGYARRVEDTVAIHAATLEEAAALT
jgi:acetoin utilization deacetylase AcuC-like enzyme